VSSKLWNGLLSLKGINRLTHDEEKENATPVTPQLISLYEVVDSLFKAE
jgi:hypothetical protein